MRAVPSLPTALLAALLGLAACGPPPVDPPSVGTINLARVEPETVLPGTRLRFVGSGFLPDETVEAHFQGTFGGGSVDGTLPLRYESVTEQVLVADDTFFALLGGDNGTFGGRVTLSVMRKGQLLEDTESVSLSILPTLTPTLLQIEDQALAFMERARVDGRGFLLPGEGETRFLFNGTFTPNGGAAIPLSDAQLTVDVEGRVEAFYLHTPEALGLAAGTLEGELLVENHHLRGDVVTGGSLPVLLTVLEPAVASASPSAASRGQIISFLGRGFLPDDSSKSQRTVLVFDGTFTTGDGTVQNLSGANALELFPTYEEPGRVSYVIRPTRGSSGNLEGLGSVPGTFDGEARIRLEYDGAELVGPPWLGTFQIVATKQVVYLKYLDSFSDGLARFGLRNVEQQVRARVLEVCERDYQPYNVEFREERPTDFHDYSVIEVSAIDPNGAGLFGLDNTEGKDEGNNRLNDVIGGRNAESQEQGFYAFGGVFVESFLSFSPKSASPSPMSTDRFDRIFDGIVPELGGAEVMAGEFPGGQRDTEISEALRVLGNLIGNTLVHEIGHSLGMAAVPTGFHHDGSTPGLIMNAGSARSFEERAELDGQGPAVWGSTDGAYLESILPK
ncbi:MAG: hypothetical protein P1V51_12595 [Deltaproteobacteria bacterium]|nr:hypothetical protein [Deltaproteobacteria bacterium]